MQQLPMLRSLPAALIAAIILSGAARGRDGPVRTGSIHNSAQAAATSAPGSAEAYFDRARRLGFAAAGQTAPYSLRADFTTRASSGAVATGTYTDLWLNEKQWRREATLSDSRFVRSRNGKQWYRLTDGPDAALLQFVLTALEPLPESTRHESEWKIATEPAGGVPLTRVSRGKLTADGSLDPKDAEAYWFDAGGQLVRSYLNGLDIRRTGFADFNGVDVARELDVTLAGKTGMKILVTGLDTPGQIDPTIFVLKGNEWRREYTTEVR